LFTGNPEFVAKEEENSKAAFDVKPKSTTPLDFAGININRDEDGFTLDQEPYILELQPLGQTASFQDLQKFRGKLLWTVHTRLDMAAPVSQLAQVTANNFKAVHVSQANKILAEMKRNPVKLYYPKLDLSTAKLVVYTDASFATNEDLSSQFGFILFAVDGAGRSCILDGQSSKCRRVTRSVLGAELFAMSHGYDRAAAMQHALSKIRKLPIVIVCDSMQIFSSLTKLTAVSERRLMVDLAVLREAYEKDDIETFVHVRTHNNLADVLAKDALPGRTKLQEILNSGKLDIVVNCTVSRTTPAWELTSDCVSGIKNYIGQ
jgi:hypothetical protein